MITGAEVIGIVVIAGVVGVPECVFTDKGLEYKGFEYRTAGNIRCQEWESQTVSITKKMVTGICNYKYNHYIIITHKNF